MNKVQDYLNDCLSIDALEEWVVARLPSIYESETQDVTNTVDWIMLSLIEIENDRMTEYELKKSLIEKMIYCNTENTQLSLTDKVEIFSAPPEQYEQRPPSDEDDQYYDWDPHGIVHIESDIEASELTI